MNKTYNKVRNTGSPRPYLIRAFYEWIVDNHWTPYIIVNTLIPGTQVPEEYIEDSKITLNIAPAAVKDLSLGNDRIDFYARFSGIVNFIHVPVKAILAIYAYENGRGSAFGEEEEEENEVKAEPLSVQPHNQRKPVLRIVKPEPEDEAH